MSTPTIPSPEDTIQDLFNFEDQLEALFYTIFSTDPWLLSEDVEIDIRRSLVIQNSPRIELDVDLSANMDWMSFRMMGNPARQVPNAFIGTVSARVVTTRVIDTAPPLPPIHGLIRGRARWLLSAAANLFSSMSVYPYFQILELLPNSASMDVQDSKDTDTTFISYRMKFAINDFAWPIVTIPPANVAVVHPAVATFAPEVFLPQVAVNYQWQVSINGGTSWTNTADGAVYTGSATGSLAIITSVGLNNYQYRLIITCPSYGSTVTSGVGILSVT